jgi:hypothetical protein
MHSLATRFPRLSSLLAWAGMVALVLALVPLLGNPLHALPAPAGGDSSWLELLGLSMMGLIEPIITPKTKQQLAQIVDPQVVAGGQSEATPWVLYDTQLYTSAATTTQTFFATQQNDRTLSNLLQAGALTDPQYFEIFNLGFDVLQDLSTSAGAETGVLDDIQKLMLVGRPIFTLTISDKNYGPFPLSFLHTSGGAVGMGWGTFTAEESIEYGNNSLPDGGWNWRGSVVIPPKVGFSVTVQWAAAQTLAAGNPQVRFWMAGCLHRRVL